ncbi:MAG TPA: hypothetical protein VJZ00_21250 [Thermoanaerobaculia bacterium]|nr:hypothetical protein [Thermoanaerobaculia bacterium]
MNDLEQMRANALAQIDRAERWYKLCLFGAVTFEMLFTVGLLLLVDYHNRLHLLLVCCTGLIYMPVVLGLLALGAHVNRCTLRVLARLDAGS